MRNREILSIICLILLSGCSSVVENKFHTLDFTKKITAETSFDLSEIMDDIDIIKLESSGDKIISHFNGYANDKHIVQFNREEILQFSADGRYIGVVAIKGKGPNEFNNIGPSFLSDNTLFFHEQGSKNIRRYNLNSNKFEQEITLPIDKLRSLSAMTMVNDSTLAVIPGIFANCGYKFFYLSLNGDIIGGETVEIKDDTNQMKMWAGRSPILQTQSSGEILYYPTDNDTIFHINNSIKTPQLLLNTLADKKSGSITTSYSVSQVARTKDQILLGKFTLKMNKTKNSISIESNNLDLFIFKEKSNSLSKISSITDNSSGVEIIDMPYIPVYNAGHMVIPYYSDDFKEILEASIDREDISEEKRKSLIELNNTINEGDNPILITGVVKK